MDFWTFCSKVRLPNGTGEAKWSLNGALMEPKWSLFGSQKKDNILTTFLIINLPHFSLSVKWAENELEMRHKNDNILTTFWQHFDNIFRTFWKWQRFDNILTTFWQHFLKKYLRENELILSCKWAVNYPIGMGPGKFILSKG